MNINESNAALDYFISEGLNKNPFRVLELGTKRWNPEVPTHHKHLYSNATEVILTDIEDGIDVDVVADAHNLFDVFGYESFDGFFSDATFEHLVKPWIVAEQIHKILKSSGIFFVQTVQTFPLHGYPNDYFRFSIDALESMFSMFTFTISNYSLPCKIIPNNEITGWGYSAPSFLMSCIGGKK